MSSNDGAHDPKSLVALSRKWLLWLEETGRPRTTVTQRTSQVGRFVRWCGEQDIERAPQVTRKHVERYQRSLYYAQTKDGNPLSRKSQALLLNAVTVWFRWLLRRGHIMHNPAADIELPKYQRNLPRRTFTAHEVERVLETCDLETLDGLRNRAVLELLYSTGIRRAELALLGVSDLDFERELLLVRSGKGGKQRLIPVGRRAILWLRRYFEEVREKIVKSPDDGALFLSMRGRRMHINRFGGIAREAIAAAGLSTKGMACHVFRHTTATLMLEGGADIRHIQELLGHAHLNTTQIYTKVSVQKLKEVHTKTHPAKMERESGGSKKK